MSSQPFFSVITPTYNRVKFLAEMIGSVQSQSFKNYEHIIVDDGSTDDTEAMVTEMASNDSKIIYLKQGNCGRSAARNVGMNAAKGEYICFLDSDDVWLPNHLSELSERVQTEAAPKMYHTGLIWFYDDGRPQVEVKYKPRGDFHSDVEYVIANEIAPDCVCVHASILQKHQFNPQLYINEDVELWSRIAAEHSVESISSSTAKLRVHSENTDKVFADSVTPKMEAFDFILSNPSVRKKLSKGFIQNKKRGLHELMIRQHEKAGNQKMLVIELVRFLSRFPTNPRNKSKLVTLLYNLPGGSVLKRLIKGSKQTAG